MRICLLLFFCISSFASLAQSESFSAEKFWLKKISAESDIEEDIESYFPIIQSAKNPIAAAAINMVLQMETFGMTLNEKNKVDLLSRYKEGYAFQVGSYTYVLKPITRRLLYIGIGRYRTNSAMSLNGHYEMKHFYFDATTGLRTYKKEWFTRQGLAGIGRLAVNDFKEQFISSIAQFRENFSEKDLPAFNEECECDCMEYIRNAFCGVSIMIDYATATSEYILTIEDCDWMNPRQHTTYVANISSTEITPLLSPYGKFLIMDGSPAATPPFFKLWKGTVGKIPIHFTLQTNDNCFNETMGNGQEIYDKYGVVIQTSWSVENNMVTIEELDNGNPIAKISATLKDGKLTGTWTKKDGSKTLPFEAVVVSAPVPPK